MLRLKRIILLLLLLMESLMGRSRSNTRLPHPLINPNRGRFSEGGDALDLDMATLQHHTGEVGDSSPIFE